MLNFEIEATICMSNDRFSNTNTLRLYPEPIDFEDELKKLNVEEQFVRQSKRSKNQRKKAAQKNRFPVGLRKELACIKKEDKIYNSRKKTRQQEKRELNKIIIDEIQEKALIQKEIDEAEYKAGFDFGRSAGYFGEPIRINIFESPIWNEGYIDGYPKGASERR